MKFLALLMLSMIFMSCASHHHDRRISSEEPSKQERARQLSEFGSGYRN